MPSSVTEPPERSNPPATRNDAHAEDARTRAELVFRALSAASPFGIFVTDRDGAVTFANARCAEILECSEEALLGDGWFAVLDAPDRREVRLGWAHAVRRSEQAEHEFRIVTSGADDRWARVTESPLLEAGNCLGVVGTVTDVTVRRRALAAERAARDAANAEHRRLLAMMDALPVGVVVVNPDFTVTMRNRAVVRILGDAANLRDASPNALRLWWTDSGHQFPVEEAPIHRALMHGEAAVPREIDIEHTQLERTTFLHSAAPVRDGAGAITGAVSVFVDVSERAALQAQLRQALKMEAIGQLAGGVAHDLNNLLTVINGSLEFVQEDLDANHHSHHDIEQIVHAASRATALVRKLLAFSRKQTLTPRTANVGQLVRGTGTLLRRVIGEEITLEIALADDVGSVRVDAHQFEQVLINLAVNARDAMLSTEHGHDGAGGTLSLEAANVTLSDAEAVHRGVPRGAYVRIACTDTGSGMTAAVRAKLFEPFFTTKEIGRGTGLGLATVYGIVSQSGGAVWVDSSPGSGARFSVLLPFVEAEQHTEPAGPQRDGGRRRFGTILLVEDERPVRATVRRLLEREGYAVLEARHGADALMLWYERSDAITAVVTDVRMPQMGGKELVEILRAQRPRLPVVFISGYAPEVDTSLLDDLECYVEKPFNSEALLAAVEGVIDRSLLPA